MHESYSDESSDHIEQIALIEAAFDDVGVRTDIESALSVFAGFEPGNQHDRKLMKFFILSYSLCEFEAVHARHLDV